MKSSPGRFTNTASILAGDGQPVQTGPPHPGRYPEQLLPYYLRNPEQRADNNGLVSEADAGIAGKNPSRRALRFVHPTTGHSKASGRCTRIKRGHASHARVQHLHIVMNGSTDMSASVLDRPAAPSNRRRSRDCAIIFHLFSNLSRSGDCGLGLFPSSRRNFSSRSVGQVLSAFSSATRSCRSRRACWWTVRIRRGGL